MKKQLFIVVIIVMIIASPAFGEIKVYDANDDFLGYLVDIDDGMHIKIYVPSLDRFMEFIYDEEDQYAGRTDIGDTVYYGGEELLGNSLLSI